MDTINSESAIPAPYLQIDDAHASYLREIAGWAKFLAIVGFVFSAIIVLIAIFLPTAFSSMNSLSGTGVSTESMGVVLAVVYLLFGFLYFFPCYYLFNFAIKMKAALIAHDQVLLSHSFRNLKSCFKFFGIMTIIILSLYGVVLIGLGIGIGVGSLNKSIT